MEQSAGFGAASAAITNYAADIGENAPGGDDPMTIGEVARTFGMTLRALRFYESKHLLTPQRRGAIRFYRRCDRERIALIMTGRRLGFTLAEIADLVDRSGGHGLNLSREKCVEQINLLERQKRGIEVAIAELRQIYTSFYKMLLDEPQRVEGFAP
jgi:DNA-binding transcriptional MerR regulator